jgi:hypothetical protein
MPFIVTRLVPSAFGLCSSGIARSLLLAPRQLALARCSLAVCCVCSSSGFFVFGPWRLLWLLWISVFSLVCS